jgi:hypothetical protein
VTAPAGQGVVQTTFGLAVWFAVADGTVRVAVLDTNAVRHPDGGGTIGPRFVPLAIADPAELWGDIVRPNTVVTTTPLLPGRAD